MAAIVSRALHRVAPHRTIEPCMWGPTLGAQLHLGGRSIPYFQGTPKDALANQHSGQAALWEVLNLDPLFEFREIAALPRSGIGYLGDSDAAEEFLSVIRNQLQVIPRDFENYIPSEIWKSAVDFVFDSKQLQDAIRSAREVNASIRGASARAITAQIQLELVTLGYPSLCMAQRDHVVAETFSKIGGADMGLFTSGLTSLVKGLAASALTKLANRNRDALFDSSHPLAGDILLYQSRGQAIRHYIARRIDSCGDDVVVVAHSLGGLACVDLLVMDPRPNVRCLITVGSQAPLLYELGALTSLAPGEPLPKTFPRQWVNIYCRNDLLSYLAEPVFGAPAQDIEVANQLPFPQSHSAYWNNDAMWDSLAKFL